MYPVHSTISFACTPYWYKILSNNEQPAHPSFKLFTHKNNSNPYERFHIQHVWIFFSLSLLVSQWLVFCILWCGEKWFITNVNQKNSLHQSFQNVSKTCFWSKIQQTKMQFEIPNLINRTTWFIMLFYSDEIICTVLPPLNTQTLV